MPPKPSKPVNCNRKALPVADKLELIRKLKKGTSVAKLCEEYGVAKQIVSDIKKAKTKLMEYAAQYCVDATTSKSGQGLPRKHMKTARETGLDAAVMKWYVQERSLRISGYLLYLTHSPRKLENTHRAPSGWPARAKI
ncbi:Tigger transposable element-derived protein 2 [Portunus trituberculatus]|uniref:Tigger transposable element-derived protein 2 n=1 Tax=Portunus trituberculatus TaxID=210409 RepID=A0A5B7EHG7_PORTR|nr:Tigger transposable element-derived protein 2 [Portunus trituberculatus]